MTHLLAQQPLQQTFFGGNRAGTITSVSQFISTILPNVYIIAGVILFIYIVAGGFMIISAAGNPDSAKEGQKIITNAIIGFIILFCSYWIIQIIEVVTGVQILNPLIQL